MIISAEKKSTIETEVKLRTNVHALKKYLKNFQREKKRVRVGEKIISKVSKESESIKS